MPSQEPIKPTGDKEGGKEGDKTEPQINEHHTQYSLDDFANKTDSKEATEDDKKEQSK
ncbi:hypothetical protein AUP68_09210 [Ilyonectria robusta]